MSPTLNRPTSSSDRAFSKKDAQKLAAVVLAAVVVVALFWRFVMKPLQKKIHGLNSQLQEVTRKYEGNRRLADSEKKVSLLYYQKGSKLMKMAKTQVPPSVNAVAWVSDRIMAAASEVPKNFDIISIGDAGVELKPRARKARSKRKKKAGEARPVFKDLLFRVQIRAGYHELGRFLASLEKENRFMRVKSLSMSRSEKEIGSRAVLKVELVCVFPGFTEDGFPEEVRPSPEKLKKACLTEQGAPEKESTDGKSSRPPTADKTAGDYPE